jgi:hypothetical protein
MRNGTLLKRIQMMIISPDSRLEVHEELLLLLIIRPAAAMSWNLMTYHD